MADDGHHDGPDPLGSVAESEAAHEGHEDVPPLQGMGFPAQAYQAQYHPGMFAAGPMGAMMAPPPPPARNQQEANLTLTAQGIRTILGRKARSKPLLQLWCKGCGGSTHCKDIFVESDYLESFDCILGFQSAVIEIGS